MKLLQALASTALLTAMLAAAPPPSAHAASRGDLAIDPDVAGPAWAEEGIWRTKVQLLFDPAKGELTRRSYTLWDPEPSRDLDFIWTPANPRADKPGRISGHGHIVWRIKGRPSYDKSAVFAEFRGRLRDGRIEGRGTYLEKSGVFYEGEWRNGRMEGRGSLKMPSGDEYAGEFKAGKANGRGRYIDVTGEVYEGPFVDGRRHGRGTTTLPNNRKYASLWTDGKEAEGSRLVRLAQSPGKGLPGGADDIRLGVLVDKKFPPPPRGGQQPRTAEPGDLLYTISSTANGLAIRPEDRRLMSLWKGGGEIQLLQTEYGVDDEYGVLSKSRSQLVPLTLVLEVQNRSTTPVNATGVYLDVRSSATDAQPAIQLVTGQLSDCVGPTYLPSFKLENFGWSAAEQARIQFDFAAPNTRPASLGRTINVGSISRSSKVDLTGTLQSAGVNTGLLASRAKSGGINCPKPKTLQGCLQDLKAAGAFGSLADRVVRTEGFILLNATGRLEYSWRDAKGTVRQSASPFTATLPLAHLRQETECGEGAGREPITAVAQSLRLDATNYRIPLSFRSTIPAGRTSQFTLPIKADKSSEHDFSVVLQLSDGREIRSRPINLLYYVPSWFPKPAS